MAGAAALVQWSIRTPLGKPSCRCADGGISILKHRAHREARLATADHDGVVMHAEWSYADQDRRSLRPGSDRVDASVRVASSSAANLSCSTALSALSIGQSLVIDGPRSADRSGKVEAMAGTNRAAIGVYQDVHQGEHPYAAAYRETGEQPNPEWRGQYCHD